MRVVEAAPQNTLAARVAGAACCSSQLKAQDAFRPPSAVGSSPVSVSCPVSSNKLVFISVRTWRAMGASSRTAFSKWASLSFRLAEPPCVPSRQNGRLVIYVGTALSCIAYLLLRIICAVHVQTYICQKKVLTPMGHFSKMLAPH